MFLFSRNLTRFPFLNKSGFLNPIKCIVSSLLSSSGESKEMVQIQVLNVAEKNDAAKNIAELLSRGHYNRREGKSKFNKIYEFEHRLFDQNVKMAMTSVSGHLLTLDFTGSYRSWKACNPVALFDAPIIKFCPENSLNIKKTLEIEIKKSKYLIIWTDCDREGENIGYEVIEVCLAAKPGVQVFRAKFSEITYQSIMRAIQNLGPPNQNVNEAVNVRQELDLRIGAAFTRFQTLRLQQVFPTTLEGAMISYGSCQFPTLGFIVERYRAIEDFVREPFWKLKVVWEPNEDEKVEFLWKRNHLFDQLTVQILLEKCLEKPEAQVIKVQTKNKSKWRPVPLDTVEMEKLASRKLRINAKETMKIAEKLYTAGYISYPRTETNIFPKEMDLRPLVEMQTGDGSWGGFAQRVLDEGITPRQGKKSDQAHPPIHPTKYVALNKLGDEKERKIYEFIVRHFLACVSKDAQGYETVAEIDINEEGFVASGLQIVARNYLEVYPYDRWSDKSLPQFSEGSSFDPTSITMEEGSTCAPNLLSEADLIALMEKHGIGTDATHAEHIETIKSRMYAGVQDDGRFLPRSLGMGLVKGYDAMGIALSKPNLRAELEADLKRICEGTRNWQDVLKEQVDKYREVFVQAMAQVIRIDDALAEYFPEERQPATDFPPDGGPGNANQVYRKCPLCNSDMVLRRKRDSTMLFFSCMGFPQCKASVWLPASVERVEIDAEPCPRCTDHPPLLRFTFTPGSYTPFYPDSYKGCIGGCDQNFNELLNIRRIQASGSNSNTTQPNRNQGPTQRPPPQPRPPPPRPQGHNNTGSSNGSDDDTPRPPMPPPPRMAIPPPQRPAPPNSGNRPTWNGPPPSDGDSSEIVCRCNESAMLLTVRKEGPNTGKQFYKCSKPQGAGCDFFLWAGAEPQEAPSTHSGSSGSRNYPTQQSYQPPPPANDDGVVHCKCGEDAKLLTVNKTGPNQGKQFYACPKPREAQCDFFQWADEASGGGGGGGGGGARAGGSRNYPTQSYQPPPQDNGDGAAVQCGCGEEAKLLTVNKAGPNQGKQFYGCPKPRDAQCGFFEWADGASGGGGGGGGDGDRFGNGAGSSRGGRGRGRGGTKPPRSSATGTRKPRKCSQCGQEGHTRNNCPDLA